METKRPSAEKLQEIERILEGAEAQEETVSLSRRKTEKQSKKPTVEEESHKALALITGFIVAAVILGFGFLNSGISHPESWILLGSIAGTSWSYGYYVGRARKGDKSTQVTFFSIGYFISVLCWLIYFTYNIWNPDAIVFYLLAYVGAPIGSYGLIQLTKLLEEKEAVKMIAETIATKGSWILSLVPPFLRVGSIIDTSLLQLIESNSLDENAVLGMTVMILAIMFVALYVAYKVLQGQKEKRRTYRASYP